LIYNYKPLELDNYFRKLFNISYIAYGYKKVDSLSRRGIIWHGNGIDERNKKIYPVADFTEKDIFYYIKKNKLKLSPEYQYGFRDINTFFKKDCLMWLRNTFYNDYLNVINEYPLLESVLYK
jgi:phosphoadenosine phosphosulfate reductase